jgi:hypothetical protein
VICDRNALHCSYPNFSPRLRVTFNFGAHRKKWVLHTRARALNGYDEEQVVLRSRCIQVAADARSKRYPDEPRFSYWPLRHEEDKNVWDGWEGDCAAALNSKMLSL